jgi:hypothetical protein
VQRSEVDILLEKLGLPAAPMVRSGLGVVVGFFHSALHTDPIIWWEYVRGIDFHQPVRVEALPAGTQLIHYESLGQKRQKPFTYFTRPGTSPHATGTSFPSVQFKRFETTTRVPALVSVASPMQFNDVSRQGQLAGRMFDRVSRPGGGLQYIVPSDAVASFKPLP